MKIRVVAIILLLSLIIFFGFKKVSANKTKEQSKNIAQLNILKYIPENNKLLFISNLESFDIFNNNEKDENSNQIRYFSYLRDLNFLIKNILKISNKEFIEIISQSILEKNPILYTETSLKIP